MKKIISTPDAPQAIGTYSQAVKFGNLVYISGQLPLDPKTMEVVSGDITDRIDRVIKNIRAITEASGGSLNDIIKLNVFLTNMEDFPCVNQVMEKYFNKPYPTRAAIAVKDLPKGVDIEIEAVMGLG